MKQTTKIHVPRDLIFENSIGFVKSFNELPIAEEYLFDFGELRRIDPFSLLFVSSELQRYREKNKGISFIAINYESNTYASHMGFFKAFGLPFGKKPGEAKGSDTYLPIHIYNTSTLRLEANELMINPAELLENKAKVICSVLTRSDKSVLFEVLVYCLREILRNVLEHSQAEQFGFCAQYLPSLNRVSFAIIDRGIGIKTALSSNPTLNIFSDEDAIITALKPGVSGKVYQGQKRKPKGDWANSGYGLFMTSSICKMGGGFFIASGSTGYYVSENKERFLETPFEGTALNLTLDTTRLGKLSEMLREIDKQGSLKMSNPSKSSLGLLNK